jgi:hypothetical protein
MVVPRCCDCKYFESDDMKNKLGSCHHYAPVPCMRDESDIFPKYVYWPAVSSSDWCGQFSSKHDSTPSDHPTLKLTS